jgi:preprotein translocase SecE subunit
MPSVKEKEQAMATTNGGAGAEPRSQQPQPQPPQRPERHGFFTIYKPGQGYWTRLGTGIGAALIILLTIHFFWTHLPPWIEQMVAPRGATPDQLAAARVTARNITLGICIGTGVGLSVLSWWLTNKPTNADFLIATDSEMKKVNWTSRKDLIGSTKVVIAFMFLIAFFLFAVDVIFGYFFYLIDVLKNKPF